MAPDSTTPALTQGSQPATTTTTSAPPPPPPLPPASDLATLRFNVEHNLALLNQAVHLLEPRFTTRALRALPQLRTKLGSDHSADVLAQLIRTAPFYSQGSDRKAALIDALGNPPAPSTAPAPDAASSATSMDVDSASSSSTPTTTTTPAADSDKKSKAALAARNKDELKDIATTLPEADAFVTLLAIISLLDQKQYARGKDLATRSIEHFGQLNRRSLDQLMSKLYFYWVRLHEVSGDDTAALRPTLLAAQRTAALRHDDDLQATLLPLLLRNYVDHGLYEQADRLVSKTQFPEGSAQNSQLARWYYYVGRIRAIQLDYTAAHASLLQAIRRGPSDLAAAPGFFQHAHKLAVLVELLLGEIPERRIFREVVLKKALRPYLELAQAVRVGDIEAFNRALSTHSAVFTQDRTLSLVHRLRHNVIKTALRTLSLAYSRISLGDVRAKLALDSEEDAEYIVAKAIRDGVVQARIDHDRGEMTSREGGDVYSTGEPVREFDRRIGFLLDLYNQSVKSMRYPLNAHSKELASAGEARERERELAKEIEEGDSDADLDGPGDMDSF
ncbi:26S proteasome non-ATPase regulatory subunit 3 [Rhodotorula diobovata]|uniref:26S proteasome non-ATPase regulatory subunit 3 n=1 Tax=Rhodotorula diobovata TaxID=5288 RepID=A0A5C5FVY0_9BASI|nr:26S proteasome non-ATPase regulatory subunit 3 [Rhodotorula diobovata]